MIEVENCYAQVFKIKIKYLTVTKLFVIFKYK